MLLYATIIPMKLAKIILGAKNTDIKMLEDVITSYALAGVDIIDVSADKIVITSAKKIINNLHLKNKPKICASITLNNDIHSAKAKINKGICSACTRCVNICPQKAISMTKNFAIIKEERCTGCKQCVKVCPNGAVELYNINKSFEEQFAAAKDADYIEIHTNGTDENVFNIFDYINKNYTGEIGICISKCSDVNKKIDMVTKISDMVFPKKLIVQADGSSISGFDNNISTAMPAIEEAKLYQNIDNIIIILSGGTNEQTYSLAKNQQVRFDGIAWGTYARKIILNANSTNEQGELAKNLIQPLKANM